MASQFRIKPHHCAMSVPDIERSIAWYRDKLGFALEKRSTLESLGAKVAFICKDDFRMELFELPQAEALPASRRKPNEDLRTHGTKHVAFCVTALDRIVETLKQKGVHVAMGPMTVENTRVVFINDDTGNLIELIEEL